MRDSFKAGAARLLHATRLDRLLGKFAGSRKMPVILGYHRVVEDFAESARTSIPSLLISRTMLERHLDWVGKRYQFIDLDDLGSRLESGERLDSPLAALTFDDGYSDFYQHAAPILRAKGIPATVFVVASLVGTPDPQMHDRLYLLLAHRKHKRFAGSLSGFVMPSVDRMNAYQATRALIQALPLAALWQVIHTLEAETGADRRQLNSPRSMNWDELLRVRRQGFLVGSHTSNHVVLTNEDHSCIARELSKSRADLEEQLQTRVHHFAYPSGLFNATSVSAVAEAGYRFAYTGCTHRSASHPLLTIPRTVLWQNSCLDAKHGFSESVLSCQVNRVFDLVNGCCERHELVN